MGNERVIASTDRILDTIGDHVIRDVDWFMDVLAQNDVSPPRGSVLRDSLDVLREIGRAQASQLAEASPTDDELIDGMSAYFVIQAVKALHDRAPQALDDFWRIFRGGDILVARPGERSHARDAMFEVSMAAVAAGISNHVDLRGSRNPDVFFAYRGRAVGFECRAVYGSDDRDKIRRIVREKARQVRDRNPDVEYCWIAIDLSATISYLRESAYQMTRAEAGKLIEESVFAVKDHVLSDRDLCETLRGLAPKLVGLLFFANAAYLAVDRMSFVQHMHQITVASRRSSGTSRRSAG